MSDMLDIHEHLGDNVSVGETSHIHIKERVVENLRLLVPKGRQAARAKMLIINWAVRDLCYKAKAVHDIDWLAVFALAADINELWNSDCLKE